MSNEISIFDFNKSDWKLKLFLFEPLVPSTSKDFERKLRTFNPILPSKSCYYYIFQSLI